MKQSSDEVKKALRIVGNVVGFSDDVFDAMYASTGMYGISKEIIFQMYVKEKLPYSEKDDEIFRAMMDIRYYVQEMSKYGEVHFGVKYGSDEYKKLYVTTN